ncbi:MAG: hypothetical protein OHK0046_44280 [Anaerolineae bacterium]
MAYGRLDVFWPDGRFESFSLEEPTVSVGRSNGCTIVLDTDTISRYHFSITLENNGLISISDLDSANGTFVDGVRVQNGEHHPLQGGEELQIGHLRMIFYKQDDQFTTAIDTEDETQHYTRENLGFHVEVYGPEIAIAPGSHSAIEISINNNTEKTQRYSVDVLGLPEGWARINRPELMINAGNGAPVLVNIKPIRRSDSAPGDYPVKVVVALHDDPDKRVEVDLTVQVLPFSGFGMALSSYRVTAYDRYKLHLHNQGSAPLPIFIIARSKDDALNVEIPEAQIVLKPGERKAIQGEVTPKNRPLIGVPRDQPFDLMVRSRDDSEFLAAVRAQYVLQPLLPNWATAALGIVAVLAGALLLVAVLLLLRLTQPEPQITSLTAASTQIERGQPLQLNWEANDAEFVEVWVNGELIENELPAAETTSYSLDTTSFASGEALVMLRAINNEGMAEQTLAVNVLAPLEVERFEVIPAQVYRHVVQQISVGWFVHGATISRVEGLESFDPNFVIEPSRGEEANFNVTGVANNSFELTLIAEDELNNRSIELPLLVDVVNPECITTEDDFTLYAAPDISANVISTIEAGVPLVVDGRDETGAWLRTERAGGVVAWGARTALDCIGFDAEALRIRVTEPAEAEPTQAPTAEAENN